MSAAPICISCQRYRRSVDERGPTCEAFPEGIPREILFDGADHRLPFEGDNGILFLAKSDTDAESVNRTWGKRPKAYKPTQFKVPADI